MTRSRILKLRNYESTKFYIFFSFLQDRRFFHLRNFLLDFQVEVIMALTTVQATQTRMTALMTTTFDGDPSQSACQVRLKLKISYYFLLITNWNMVKPKENFRSNALSYHNLLSNRDSSGNNIYISFYFHYALLMNISDFWKWLK